MSAEISAPFLSGIAVDLAASHEDNHSARRARPDSLSQYQKLTRRISAIFDRLADERSNDLRKLQGIEWLLDNDYVVHEALQQFRIGLPPKFYRQLPLVNDTEAGSLTRVESLIRRTIETTQLPLDLTWLEQFTAAYQTVQPLTIGELWALPALLRRVILEKLCDAAEDLFGIHDEASSVVVGSGESLAGCIVSLATIEHFEWHDFVERVAPIDQILSRDPAGAYVQMDFETRDRYRDAVEKIARYSGNREWDVAECAVYLASSGTEEQKPGRSHVGYYLIDKGLRLLEQRLGYQRSRLRRAIEWSRRQLGTAYVLAIIVSSLTALFMLFSVLETIVGAWPAFIVSLTALPPGVTLCSGILNWLLTKASTPRRLAKLDFRDGIADPWRTVVAVPAMLANTDEIDSVLANLETNYLGNSDINLHYALLTDYLDAAEPEIIGDRELLEHVTAGIEDLNKRYGQDGQSPFYLLHRRRLWNESEGRWMGWERKRGKLAEFNHFLLSREVSNFVRITGEFDQLETTRFVICLDADNHLAAGSARRMVGALAHPLNRPEFDATTGRVVAGYTIMQPRVEINPSSANWSGFSRTFTGEVTLDLYTHAVSDIYQDLIGEGIFVGKGIYDLYGFTRSVEGQLPENRILSHDLLEGLYGRAALASDIVLFEDFPPTLFAHARRQHRWIRGDWQLLPWLGWRAPCIGKQRSNFRPTLLDRWKLLDNIIRSLVPPGLLLLLLAGWWLMPQYAWPWTLLIAALPGLPILLEMLAALRRGTWRWGTIASTLTGKTQIMVGEVSRWLLTLAFLPYQSLIALDAIARTLFRVSVGKHLLEWTSAAQVARTLGANLSLANTAAQMWPSMLVALATAAAVAIWSPGALAAAAPLLLSWLLAPLVAWWINRAEPETVADLRERDADDLRRLARRTWHFFEVFMGPENQWLPPDNVQQVPKLTIAQRTSPTNIGLALLSALAAYDFGYLALYDLATRLSNSFESLRHAPKYRGHFLNWIRTSDLRPLEPHYVSTVDTGNLVASLIALVQGLEQQRSAALPGPMLQRGLIDTIDVMQTHLDHVVTDADSPELDGVRLVLDDARSTLQNASGHNGWWRALQALEKHECSRIELEGLSAMERPSVHWSAEDIAEFRSWVSCLRMQTHGALREIEEFAPWIELLAEMPGTDGDAFTDELREAIKQLTDALEIPAALDQIGEARARALPLISRLNGLLEDQSGDAEIDALKDWTARCADGMATAEKNAAQLQIELGRLISQASRIIEQTDFRFLYDVDRQLFHIGFNVSSGELDSSYYDLLASEARLTSFIAIAKRDVPVRHWAHLGRPLTRVRGMRVLMSWSATAFEYLMPGLLMACPERCLLHQSCRTAVDQQQRFSNSFDIPWGISESGYYRFDQADNYQYRAFGVPRLGLNRNQGDQLVIAPYASVLALPFAPDAVIKNLDRLRSLGLEDQYGLREALDYGPVNRFRRGRGQVVGSYMTHHQGMIMLALANALLDDNMVKRFHADPRIASIEQLLYEATPRLAPTQSLPRLPAGTDNGPVRPQPIESWKVSINEPAINVLSNGHLTVRVSGQGGGCQYWNGIALVQWDPGVEGLTGGFNIFFRDLDNNDFWSLGAEQSRAGSLQVEFGPHTTTFRHRHRDLITRMTVAVAPDSDVEIRRLVISNDSDSPRRLLISSAGEPVLASEREFRRHPAFCRLFIESKFIDETGVLLFSRRPRSSEERKVYMGHMLVTQPGHPTDRYFENDRRAFVGRGGDPRRPHSMTADQPTFNGSVETPDPQLALAASIEVPAHGNVQLAFITGVAETQRKVLDMIAHFQSMERIAWTISQAKAHSAHDLQHADLQPEEVPQAVGLLARVVWPDRLPAADLVVDCAAAQGSLWRYGISGDRPLVVTSLHSLDDLAIAGGLLKFHTYWNLRDLEVDLVFLDESMPGYTQPIRERLRNRIDKSQEHHRPFSGDVIVIPASELDPIDRANLVNAAAVYCGPEVTDIATLLRHRRGQSDLPPFVPLPSAQMRHESTKPLPRPAGLLFDNGFGGFTHDGREYVIYHTDRGGPPAPWANVLANREFGCLTTSSGLGCTWKSNSSEYRLTPWRNDPVLENPSEALYLRDEETGIVWSPTPLPMNDGMPYQTSHGQGYTCFEHASYGLAQRVTVFTDPEEPVKFISVQLTNRWSRIRRITTSYAAEWVLGNSHADNGGLLISDIDSETDAILVRNGFARQHGERVAFVAASEGPHGFTTDLEEFLGPDRSWRSPSSLWAIGLSGQVKAGSGCCAAYQVHIDLAYNETANFHFVVGAGENRSEAVELARKFRDREIVAERRAMLDRTWDNMLGHIQIETPDLGLDLLTNRWLLYQVIAGRLWGRTGFYQPGGAFGFRDQLQDSMALLWTAPDLVREQILLAASVQFEEGDVLHWWHPDPLRGVRSRCSDDLLWLPFTVAEYIRSTGDHEILDEDVPYLSGPELEPEQHEHYAEFWPAHISGSIYEHCCRAIDARLTAGAHGLPLIGTGDWNDGLNRVGIGGQGESVWLAWFLRPVCEQFAVICDQRGDTERASHYRDRSAAFISAAEENAWDGSWYLRAFYDDGESLGGNASKECSIDLNAQTWAGLSGAAPPQRLAAAMEAVEEQLVDSEHRLIKLLAPPFNKTNRDPGYIKGYPPGVRENGGHYNHAAVWAAWLETELNCAAKAYEWSSWLNPVNRSHDKTAAQQYRVEPYVLPGDICAGEDNAGRGGWTWYSGSAAWYHRLIIERLLGIVQEPEGFRVSPCVPDSWPHYMVMLKRGETTYRLTVEQPAELRERGMDVITDGKPTRGELVAWIDDGRPHDVVIRPRQPDRHVQPKQKFTQPGRAGS